MPKKTVALDDAWETSGRVPERVLGVIAGEPLPGKWNRWITQQGTLWIDKENRVYLIPQMSSVYAFNVLRFVFNNHLRDLDDPYKNPLVLALVARLRRGWEDFDEFYINDPFGTDHHKELRSGERV